MSEQQQKSYTLVTNLLSDFLLHPKDHKLHVNRLQRVFFQLPSHRQHEQEEVMGGLISLMWPNQFFFVSKFMFDALYHTDCAAFVYVAACDLLSELVTNLERLQDEVPGFQQGKEYALLQSSIGHLALALTDTHAEADIGEMMTSLTTRGFSLAVILESAEVSKAKSPAYKLWKVRNSSRSVQPSFKVQEAREWRRASLQRRLHRAWEGWCQAQEAKDQSTHVVYKRLGQAIQEGDTQQGWRTIRDLLDEASPQPEAGSHVQHHVETLPSTLVRWCLMGLTQSLAPTMKEGTTGTEAESKGGFKDNDREDDEETRGKGGTDITEEEKRQQREAMLEKYLSASDRQNLLLSTLHNRTRHLPNFAPVTTAYAEALLRAHGHVPPSDTREGTRASTISLHRTTPPKPPPMDLILALLSDAGARGDKEATLRLALMDVHSWKNKADIGLLVSSQPIPPLVVNDDEEGDDGVDDEEGDVERKQGQDTTPQSKIETLSQALAWTLVSGLFTLSNFLEVFMSGEV